MDQDDGCEAIAMPSTHTTTSTDEVKVNIATFWPKVRKENIGGILMHSGPHVGPHVGPH